MHRFPMLFKLLPIKYRYILQDNLPVGHLSCLRYFYVNAPSPLTSVMQQGNGIIVRLMIMSFVLAVLAVL